MFTRTQRGRIFCRVSDGGETSAWGLTGALNRCGGDDDVICAREARSALWSASNERFDLYILGREFPDGTGLELCRKIREFDSHTPVIFYSDDSEERLEGLAAGAQAYLVRSDLEELAATVLRLLSDKGMWPCRQKKVEVGL